MVGTVKVIRQPDVVGAALITAVLFRQPDVVGTALSFTAVLFSSFLATLYSQQWRRGRPSNLPGEHKKVAPPLQLLLIFQPWVQIFVWNFTQLLSNQVYTLSPSLVEIYWKMTKLCCFSQDNPPFSVCERHAELTECKRVHREYWVVLKLSRFEPTGLSHLGHHAGKVT